MKEAFVAAVVVALLVVVAVVITLVQIGRIDEFTRECTAAGGETRHVSTSMNGYLCIGEDGRILKVEMK